MIDIFIEAFIEDFNIQSKAHNQERANLLTQIEELTNRKRKALIEKVDGKVEEDEYLFLKNDCTEKI